MAYEDLNTKFVTTGQNSFELSPVVAEVQSIKQGLERLLSTPKGHCPFNREYGSSVYNLLFENSASLSSVQMFLYMDITNWEPRVDISPGEISIVMIDTNTYEISCNYIVRDYNVTSNVTTTLTKE